MLTTEFTLWSGKAGGTSALADGSFITFSNGADGILAQVFNVDGTTKGAPFLVAAGAQAADSEFSTTVLRNGDLVVTWEQVTGNLHRVMTRVFDRQMNPRTEAMEVGAVVADAKRAPQVVALDDGGFVVVTREDSLLASTRFDAAYVPGAPQPLFDGFNHSVTVSPTGKIVVVAAEKVTGGHQVSIGVYSPDGVELTFGRFSPMLDSREPQTSVTTLSNGQFLIGWESYEQNARTVSFQIVTEFLFEPGNIVYFPGGTGVTISDPVVQALPGGGYVIAYGSKDGTEHDLFIGERSVNLTGVILTETIGFNDSKQGSQTDPSIALLKDGRYLVSWLEATASGFEARSQIYDPRTKASNWTGSDLADQYGGTRYDDALRGGAGDDYLLGEEGNDILHGGSGSDTLIGGTGDDMYYLDGPQDVVVDKPGAGSDTVVTSFDFSLTSTLENLFGSGTADLALTGNGLSNVIKGGGGNDLIVGGLGKDTLSGGKGRDVFVFDTKPNKRKNVDKLSDFNAKYDSIWLENRYFKKLGKKGSEASPAKLKKAFFTVGKKAKDKKDYLVYDKKKGVLFYDPDGSGKAKAVEVATFKKNTKIGYADFFVI